MIDKLYYMFYCAAGNDGTKSKHEMVAYGMEIVATQILSFFTFIIFGLLNLKVSVFLIWFLIIATNGAIAYLLVTRYYIRSGRHYRILEKYGTTSNKAKSIYKTIVILIFVISFVLLFVGGITMGYLVSSN